MTTQETISQEDAYQIPTYKKMPVALVRGEGSFVWDAEGHRYLDFYGGHCVTLHITEVPHSSAKQPRGDQARTEARPCGPHTPPRRGP